MVPLRPSLQPLPWGPSLWAAVMEVEAAEARQWCQGLRGSAGGPSAFTLQFPLG